jgi:hypothetical protein
VQVVSLKPVFADSSIPGNSSSSSVPGKPLPAVDHWLVGLASGQQLAVRKVIIGIGSTNKMRIPPALSHLQPLQSDVNGRSVPNSSSSSSSSSSEAKSGSSSTDSSSLHESLQMLAVNAEDEPSSPAAASECSSDAGCFHDNSSSGWGSSSTASAASSSCGCDACEPCSAEQQQQHPVVQGSATYCNSSADESCCSSTAAGVGCSDVPGELPAAGCFPAGRMMHAWQLVQAVADANGSSSSSTSHDSSEAQQQQSLEHLGLLLPGESVLIIGGGLTSAHLAQIAANQLRQHSQDTPNTTSNSSSNSSAGESAAAAAAAPICLMMRGAWRVKQFDVDVQFMGRLRGKRLQEFGQLRSFNQRLGLIKQVLQVRCWYRALYCGLLQ